MEKGAGVAYEFGETMRQGEDAFGLAEADGVFGDQFAADAEGCGAGEDEICGGVLIDAAGGYQREIGERGFQGADVGVAADLGARKNFYEIGAGFPGAGDFGGRERTGHCDYVCAEREFDNFQVEAGAGEELRAGVDALSGYIGIEYVAGADDHLRGVFYQVGDYGDSAGDRHFNFDDGDTAAGDGFGGEEGVFGGGEADGGDDADLFDAGVNFVAFHFGCGPLVWCRESMPRRF
jgi:hypothetical protein